LVVVTAAGRRRIGRGGGGPGLASRLGGQARGSDDRLRCEASRIEFWELERPQS
jgi:hypothetical protein